MTEGAAGQQGQSCSESASNGGKQKDFDVLIVGAGFAGLYALHRLRKAGFRAWILEAGGGVGGTWYWNRYPGARCDIQSLVYCYTFDEKLHREWRWTERYATQPEILRYLNFITDRLDLRSHISFEKRVVRARCDEDASGWKILSSDDSTVSARFVFMAVGALSSRRLPGIEDLESFAGSVYHTGDWPAGGVNFVGRRVGIIGTGSSAIQAIPLLARQAKHLTVFQRTPAYVAPARNGPLNPKELDKLYADFATYRSRLRTGQITGAGDLIISDHLPPARPHALEVTPEEREGLMQARWKVGGLSIGGAFADVMQEQGANTVVAEFFRARIRDIVKDPRTAELLTPRDYPWGSKRICVGTDYYEIFNRDNVSLVDVASDPIERFTRTGLRTRSQSHELDALVLATGFDALTGALSQMNILGVDGRALNAVWEREGPQCYLGLAAFGFPNLFMINGPTSPATLGNVVVGIEQQVEWLVNLLVYARNRQASRIEPEEPAQQQWFEQATAAASDTLFVKGKNWWMKDIPGRGRVFIPYLRGIGPYTEICDQVAAQQYRGFSIS